MNTSVNGMDPVEAISSALHLPPETGINQVGESDKVSNSISWKYLTEFILDVIKNTVGGTQEIYTPQRVYSWTSMSRRQEHRHMAASEPKHNPRGMTSSIPGFSAPVFGESIGDPIGSPSDNPRNMLMEYPSGDPTDASSTVPYDKPSSKPSA